MYAHIAAAILTPAKDAIAAPARRKPTTPKNGRKRQKAERRQQQHEY
jgi:hypothetical protein